VWDREGRRYLDATSGAFCANLGYTRPDLVDAMRAAAARLPHARPSAFDSEESEAYRAELLAAAGAPFARVLLTSSGSEAVEAAMKVAVAYHRARGDADRTTVRSLAGHYHGATFGALGVTGWEARREPWAGVVGPRADGLPVPDDRSAALIAETIPVAGLGVAMPAAGTMAARRAACDAAGALWIADEVLTGFGRTGTMFACDQEHVMPDLLAVAKGLTGGYLPLAATLTTEGIFNAFLGEYHEFKTFFHGHSYTGNQLGCAAALANLRVFEEEKTLVTLQTKIGWMRGHLQRCRDLANVIDVRQCGFIGAVEVGPFAVEAQMGNKICRAMRERGVLTRPIGNVIVIMPPYCITEGQLVRIFDVLAESVKAGVG
jgi:adenosylmethionine-8-amino-7-oxononanoate aminotransferase